jgi:hypothetical protein
MTATILHIQNKNRTPDPTLVKLEDFDYTEGENIDPLTIVENPNITLYCLDFQNQRAIFVETPRDADLFQSAFFYLAQYEYAQRLIAVPYKELPLLVDRINPTKNPIELILIYSVGRCGSTLLSKVFDRVGIQSLSEPDVFSQIVGLRNPDKSNDEQITGILKACIYLLAKPTGDKKTSCCAIKFRSFAIELADLIYRAFPDAKSIFLYRNAEDTIKSSIRSFGILSKMLPTIKENMNLYSRFIPLLKDYADDIDFTDSQAVELYTTLWLSTMQSYLSLHKQGITTCALRYEDLVAQPEQILSDLFQQCGLAIAQVKNGCEAFNRDSQEGSSLSRENTRKNQVEPSDSLEIREKIDNLLKKHPTIKTSDFIVPDTLGYAK